MSKFKVVCPYCSQPLSAGDNLLGRTVKCPKCQGQLTLPAEIKREEPSKPSTIYDPNETIVPKACPLCGQKKHMKDVRLLYNHMVCRKCYYKFANLRQLAYFLDIIFLYIASFLAGFIIAIPLVIALGQGQMNADDVSNSLTCCLWPVITLAFMFKDGFSGHSLGKLICGVQVINEQTGEPGTMFLSFKRNLPLIIPVMPIVVAFQLCKGYRIGDGWASTRVIWKKYRDNHVFTIPLTHSET